MADWKYGDAGDKYPMRRGEIWKVNEALFAVGDLEEGDAPKLLLVCQEQLGVSPSCFYSDPPWDKGNARSFRTKAFGKEKSRSVDFVGSLLPRVVEACRLSSGTFAIEMGVKHVEDLIKELMNQGASFMSQARITYYRKHECRIVCGGFNVNTQAIDASEFEGMDDEKTPIAFLKPFTMDSVVFDCCVGQGLTCVASDALGKRSIGMELNPRRIACGVQAIAEITGYEPELVGGFL